MWVGLDLYANKVKRKEKMKGNFIITKKNARKESNTKKNAETFPYGRLWEN